MITPPKKASLPVKAKDWHKADIKAALDKLGWSFNQLGFAHGYGCKCALARALHQPYPKAEAIIAATIGVHPMVIWPSRYDANGNSNRPRGRSPKRPAGHPKSAKSPTHGKGNTSHLAGNPQAQAVA